jgi:hypothetical protein
MFWRIIGRRARVVFVSFCRATAGAALKTPLRGLAEGIKRRYIATKMDDCKPNFGSDK